MEQNLFTLYQQWLESGQMPDSGLCGALEKTPYFELFKQFEPTDEDYDVLDAEAKSILFWGSGLLMADKDKVYTFTELRQTIVLLICAMCDEIE